MLGKGGYAYIKKTGNKFVGLFYVSCDSATLARDCARFFEVGYEVSEATPVDMFPRTGNVETVVPLLVLTLKVTTVSLASITVFSGLDPDKLSNGLMWFGCPERLAFSISYAYRILPMLMEEFQNILLSYRLRGNAPDNSTFLGKIKYMCYQIRVIMRAFYPLMLNTAKRSRTTVEALELKGYRYAAVNREVKKLKLAQMKIGYDELLFLVVSVLWVAVTILLCSC